MYCSHITKSALNVSKHTVISNNLPARLPQVVRHATLHLPEVSGKAKDLVDDCIKPAFRRTIIMIIIITITISWKAEIVSFNCK